MVEGSSETWVNGRRKGDRLRAACTSFKALAGVVVKASCTNSAYFGSSTVDCKANHHICYNRLACCFLWWFPI